MRDGRLQPRLYWLPFDLNLFRAGIGWRLPFVGNGPTNILKEFVGHTLGLQFRLLQVAIVISKAGDFVNGVLPHHITKTSQADRWQPGFLLHADFRRQMVVDFAGSDMRSRQHQSCHAVFLIDEGVALAKSTAKTASPCNIQRTSECWSSRRKPDRTGWWVVN